MKRRVTDPALRWQRRFVLVVMGLVVLPSLGLTAFGLVAVHNEREAARRRVFKLYEPASARMAEEINRTLEGLLAGSGPALDELAAWARRRTARPGSRLEEFCRRYQATLPFALEHGGGMLLPREQAPLPTWQGFMPEEFEKLQRRELAGGEAASAAAGYRRLLATLDAAHPARCPLLAALARAQDRAGERQRALQTHGQVVEHCGGFVNHAGYNLALGSRLRRLELLQLAGDERLAGEVGALVAEIAFRGVWLRASFDQVSFVAERVLEILKSTHGGEPWMYQALGLIANRDKVLELLARLEGLAEAEPKLLAVRVAGERYLLLLRGGKTVVGLVLLPGGEVEQVARRLLEEMGLAENLRVRLLPSELPCREDCHRVLAGMVFLKKTDLAWRLQLEMLDAAALDTLARSRSRLYLWLLGLVVLLLGGGIAWTVRLMLRESRLSRLKTDFVSSVSHELRTPLTSIRMFTETLLLERVRGEEERRECLQTIAVETERLSRLVERILDFSRMEKGRRAYRFEPCQPRQLVEQALAACRSQIAGSGLEVRLEMPAELPSLSVDRDSLVEVLVNLIGNAVKYSPQGREITIGARVEGTELEIWVRDQGIGIPRSEHRKIFEKFYRVDTPRAQEVGGSGLGLSLVRYIVEAHGGTVTVDSVPGRGSTFTVRLPLAGNGPPAGNDHREGRA